MFDDRPELAFRAVAVGGVRYVDREMVRRVGLSREQVEEDADEVVCLRTAAPFFAISPHYRSVPQTPDEEVRRLLGEARAEESPMGDVETG